MIGRCGEAQGVVRAGGRFVWERVCARVNVSVGVCVIVNVCVSVCVCVRERGAGRGEGWGVLCLKICV